MLIREILEESVQKFGEVKAVKWLNRKEVLENGSKAIWELLQDVLQRCRWMQHSHVKN